MRINGRFVYLDNHSLLNTGKMHQWSIDRNLIAIEAGNCDKIINDINDYGKIIMASYVLNTHEANTSFCHFGIYSAVTFELVGYVDLQNIDMVQRNAELSLSIPEKINRNKTYGFDAFLTALYYGFYIRELNTIIVQTKQDNMVVVRMAKKLGIDGKKIEININDKYVALVKYTLCSCDYERIKNLTTGST